MNAPEPPGPAPVRRRWRGASLEVWGGVECTINRVQDAYFTQLDRSGHLDRDDDLERFAALGIRAIRYPVLWEQIAPNGLARADWSWAIKRLDGLRRHGIRPIVGLVHHGSGPRHTCLTDAGFAPGLARFAQALAERCPWVEDWTPVNEPLTTARFSGLYGLWYPHGRDDSIFVAAVLNQCKATVLSMRKVRAVNSRARLVQTDDLSRTRGTDAVTDTADFYNERQWLAWDLLCGRVDRTHALWDYLMESGASDADVLWFADNPCPPDILGVNHYVTSDRWLDHRIERFPVHHRGAWDAEMVDIESVRVLSTPAPGLSSLLQEAWERYHIPIAVTEAHIDANREDQLRWLDEIWRVAQDVRAAGADIRAVTVWALLGSFDWNCLLSACHGYYEPGVFDVRSSPPRPTALAALVTELAAGKPAAHPVLQGEGWWRRPERFVAQAIRLPAVVTEMAPYRHLRANEPMTPILISGANGTLGSAFANLCGRRNLACCLVDRQAMDIADADSVAVALDRYQPWAVINASGYVRIDEAERDVERCFRENAIGPGILAAQCARAGIRLLTFSSDQVFDGRATTPWIESAATGPLNVYGRSKQAAEQAVLSAWPQAMVVRTSAFFGPWDVHNFVVEALDELERGRPFAAAADVRVSPTYVPDLVNTCLDLLVDHESGIWHLANRGDVSWAEFAALAAGLAGIDAASLHACAGRELGETAARPAYAVLGSERATLMPTLDSALARFVAERQRTRVLRAEETLAAARIRG